MGEGLSQFDRKTCCFASQALSAEEKNYAQIKWEALGVVFGVHKFHQYLYGWTFMLYADHMPITTILGPKFGIPTLAAAHMQRWALILSACTNQIAYRASGSNSNADVMSRLPVSPAEEKVDDVFQTTYLEDLPIRACDIGDATRVDPVLSKVVIYTPHGWTQSMKDLPNDL